MDSILDDTEEDNSLFFKVFALTVLAIFGVLVLGAAAVLVGYLFGFGDQINAAHDGVVSAWQTVQGWYYWLTA